MYSAYVLDDDSRTKLLLRFPTAYDDFIGHHVTHQFPSEELPPELEELCVVGHINSGDGLEALVVRVNGNTQRPDGKTYHITWSIDPNSDYSPKDSNDLLASQRYTLSLPVSIDAAAVVLN